MTTPKLTERLHPPVYRWTPPWELPDVAEEADVPDQKTFCATGPGGGVDPTCSPGQVTNKPFPLGELRVKALEFFHAQLKEASYNDLTPRLSDSQASHYLKEAAACFKKMNERSLKLFLRHVTHITFYPNVDEVTKGLGRESMLQTNNRVLGAWERYDPEDPRGTLHLDGDYLLKTTRETYAHEFGHVIDWKVNRMGIGERISDSSLWKKAFKAELAGGQLTKYGASSPSEGFAEMHRWLLSEAGAVDSFPMCKEVFKRAGLL